MFHPSEEDDEIDGSDDLYCAYNNTDTHNVTRSPSNGNDDVNDLSHLRLDVVRLMCGVTEKIHSLRDVGKARQYRKDCDMHCTGACAATMVVDFYRD